MGSGRRGGSNAARFKPTGSGWAFRVPSHKFLYILHSLCIIFAHFICMRPQESAKKSDSIESKIMMEMSVDGTRGGGTSPVLDNQPAVRVVTTMTVTLTRRHCPQ